jgi:hypothetical protein
MSSLCSFLDADGTIDVEGAFQYLRTQYQDKDAFEECGSLLDCITEDGEINVEIFFARQINMSLIDMSLLLERGMIANDAQLIRPQCPFARQSRRSMSYQVEVVGGEKRAATPLDCQWYKMYLEFPMVNVPKFHVVLPRRFRLPHAQFIQLLSDSRENNWFPRWGRWSSKDNYLSKPGT